MRVFSRSYWLVISCTANSSRVLARKRWQTFENSWKKNTVFNEQPVHLYCLMYRCTAWQFWAPSSRSGTRARPGSRQSYATPRPCTGKLSRLTLNRSTNHADHAKEEYYTEVQIMQIMLDFIQKHWPCKPCKGFSRMTLYRSSDQEDHM